MARIDVRSPFPEHEEEPALDFVGGDPSLDLVNTVDWLADGTENERLAGYGQLVRWAEAAGVISAREGDAARGSASARPRDAIAAVERARELRAILRRVFHGVATGEGPGSAWDDLDRWLAEAFSRLRVAPVPAHGEPSARAHWVWLDSAERLDALLWPVVRSAARLLTSDEAGKIRVCAGPDCGWVYVDRSRNGLRRWCQMKTCGTAAKTRRRRRRRVDGD